MTVPILIQEITRDIYPPVESVFASEHECEGSKFHSPNPLLVHQVNLVPWNGDEWRYTSWLCGTCQWNLWVYQKLLFERDGNIPWAVQRSFGNGVRALAKKGWEIYTRDRS